MGRLGTAAALAAVAAVAMFGCGEPQPTVPDTPDGTVTAVAGALGEGKPQVLWTAMPASYQKDVEGLIRTFAEKMDAEIYDKGFGLLKKLVTVLQEKRDFILDNPNIAKGPVDVEKARAKWDSLVSALDALVNSDVSSLESLKTLDVGKFLRTTGSTMMQSAADMSTATPDDKYNTEFASKMKGVKAEVVSTEGDTATVKITVPGEDPKETEMVRVEGKWVPKDLADEWDKRIAEAKAGLAEMSKEKMAEAKPQIMMMLGAAEPMLDQLLKAENQEQFNQAIGQTMGMVMGAVMGGMGRPKPPRPMPEPPKKRPEPKAPEKAKEIPKAPEKATK
jgi:hypothetical protein